MCATEELKTGYVAQFALLGKRYFILRPRGYLVGLRTGQSRPRPKKDGSEALSSRPLSAAFFSSLHRHAF